MIYIQSKKGISPLIATVLLIGFTIVLAALVMRWGGTLFKTTTQTTGCESEGRLKCVSQVDISIGTIVCSRGGSTIDNCNLIDEITVNNEATTQSLEAFNVQREWSDGSRENQEVKVTIATGSSAVLLEPPWRPPDSVIYTSMSSGTLAAIQVTPIFTQTAADGTSCKMVCTEQTERIPKGDPRIT